MKTFSPPRFFLLIVTLFTTGLLFVGSVIVIKDETGHHLEQLEYLTSVIKHISSMQENLQYFTEHTAEVANPAFDLGGLSSCQWLLANVREDPARSILQQIQRRIKTGRQDTASVQKQGIVDLYFFQQKMLELKQFYLQQLQSLPESISAQKQFLHALLLSCGLTLIALAVLLWVFRFQLRARIQLSTDALNINPYPVLIIDAQGEIVEANQAARVWSHRFSAGLKSLLPQDLRQRLSSHLDRNTPAYWVWQYWIQQHEVECTVSYSPDVEHYALFLRDITQWNNSAGPLPVTEPIALPHRQVFTERVEAFFRQSPFNQLRSAFILVSMDRFKVIQASIGHQKGDGLLILAGERLQRVFFEFYRTLSQFNVYRFERNVFAIVLQGYENRQQIQRLVDISLFELAKPYHLDGREFHLTASIGISLFPEHGQDSVTILKNAESALSQALGAGGNRAIFYSREMNAMAATRLEKENFLRYAIERNELCLLYQPQINLSNGQVCGVEALLRWRHPVYGVMSPDEFIPLAGEIGLVSELTEWALRHACYQKKRWERLGFASFPVAINISAEQFLLMDLPSLLAEVLEEIQLSPTSLELEITENVAVQDVVRTKKVMLALRDMDIQLAIDDFGTGFATMSYLKAFPVDKIKIDKEFVQNLTVDIHDAAICRSIITLANNLSIKVIAEGVDSEKQLNWLKNAGCHEVQGYYFYPPLLASQVKNLLKVKKAYIMA